MFMAISLVKLNPNFALAAPTTQQRPSLIGRVQQAISENLPVVKQTLAEKLPVVKQTLTETLPAIISGRSHEETREVPVMEDQVGTGIIKQLDTKTAPIAQPVQNVDVLRRINMDEAGHVTQVQTTIQNVSLVPATVKDISINQPVSDPLAEDFKPHRPVSDNYEFQGQSLPAPIQSQTRQKVQIPTPQVMTDENVYQEGSFH